TVPPTLVVLALMSIFAWFFIDIDWGYAGPVGASLTGQERLVAMSIVMTAIGIGWGITWLAYAGDYSRFVSPTSPKRKLFLASALGQFIPVVWLGLLGATLATTNGSVDPGEMIVGNFGGLAIPVLLLVLHGPIATNVLNIYSFSLAVQALDVRVSRRVLNLLMGAFAFIACIIFVFQDDVGSVLDAWLVGIVSWVAPWAAVMLVQFFVFDRRNTDFGYLFDAVGSKRMPDIGGRALLSFAIGVFFTWLFLSSSVPALQGPLSLLLGGIDLSWLAGGVSSGLSYYLLSRTSHRAWLVRRLDQAPTAAPLSGTRV
ncbi:MAG: putative cytosine/purine/uracil/thiamine/allantoin permease family protein, partial [Glaciihabitans sp.]|nr:putative cytosine/purine/uracil/thiamine/allantoin permease family protein [Glaciihabitans sp.]